MGLSSYGQGLWYQKNVYVSNWIHRLIKKTQLIVFTIFFVLLSQSSQSQKIVVINLDYIVSNNNQYQEVLKKNIKSSRIKKKWIYKKRRNN